MSNYIIAIGGSGARCVESMLHLCAAGLGPKDLSIIVVDQDEGNGNLIKSNELVKIYQDCREFISSQELFSTRVSVDGHWVPSTDSNNSPYASLGEFFDYDGISQELKDLCESLYSEDELNVQLGRGFLGHPNIGAPFMTAFKERMKFEPLRIIFETIKNKLVNEEVRIFIIGSAFGGTGAAGFPVIARILRDYPKEDNWNRRERLFIGGALVLPYFGFNVPLPEAIDENIYTRSDNFAINTKAALMHYANMNAEINSFDSIYYVGDPGSTTFDFATGGNKQRNQAHHVELLVALAARRFYSQTFSQNHYGPEHFFLDRQKEGEIVWRDLPTLFSDDVRRKILYFTTLTCSFLTFYYPLLRKIDGNQWNERLLPWFIDHFKESEIPSDESNGQFFLIRNFMGRFLTWMKEIHSNQTSVELLNINAINELMQQFSENINQDLKLDDENFCSILPDKIGTAHEASKKKSGFDSFWHEVCKTSGKAVGKQGSPASRFLRLLYDSSKRFCQSNYKLDAEVIHE